MTKYTKDKLIEEFVMISKRNIEAFDGVKEALNNINDQNKLHMAGEDARIATVKKLVDGNEKFYKIVNYLLIILVAAVIILAGAEKALKFVPNF